MDPAPIASSTGADELNPKQNTLETPNENDELLNKIDAHVWMPQQLFARDITLTNGLFNNTYAYPPNYINIVGALPYSQPMYQQFMDMIKMKLLTLINDPDGSINDDNSKINTILNIFKNFLGEEIYNIYIKKDDDPTVYNNQNVYAYYKMIKDLKITINIDKIKINYSKWDLNVVVKEYQKISKQLTGFQPDQKKFQITMKQVLYGALIILLNLTYEPFDKSYMINNDNINVFYNKYPELSKFAENKMGEIDRQIILEQKPKTSFFSRFNPFKKRIGGKKSKKNKKTNKRKNKKTNKK